MWTIISEIERANPTKGRIKGARQWAAECNVCNSIIKVESDDIKRLKSRKCFTCLMKERSTKNAEEYTINEAFRIYKKSAQKRGYKFLLTKELFTNIVKSNCVYCGIQPSRESERARKKYKSNILLNGIDRVHNTIGYTKENSVPCCSVCNYAKNNMNIESWNNWIKRIVIFNVQRLS